MSAECRGCLSLSFGALFCSEDGFKGACRIHARSELGVSSHTHLFLALRSFGAKPSFAPSWGGLNWGALPIGETRVGFWPSLCSKLL